MKLLSEFLPWISPQTTVVSHSSRNISSTLWSSNPRTSQDGCSNGPPSNISKISLLTALGGFKYPGVQKSHFFGQPINLQPPVPSPVTCPLDTAGSPMSDYGRFPSPSASVSCYLFALVLSPAQASSMVSHTRSNSNSSLEVLDPSLHLHLQSTPSRPLTVFSLHEPLNHCSPLSTLPLLRIPPPKAFLSFLIYGLLPALDFMSMEKLS